MCAASGINNFLSNDLLAADVPKGRSGWLRGIHFTAALILALGVQAVEPQPGTATPETPLHPILAAKSLALQPRSAPVAIALADTSESGLHTQVATELVRLYNCCVLNRMRGMTLYSEQQLEDLVTIDQMRERAGGVRASDFVVAINHGTTEHPNEIAFEVSYADMKAPSGSSNAPPDKLRLASWDGAPQRLAETIARRLDLSARPNTGSAEADRPTNRLTMVVFPFARFDKCPLNPTACGVTDVLPAFDKASGNPKASDIVDTLYLRAELAVQQGGNGQWQLVDHVVLDKALSELKLRMAAVADPASASALAKMVAADRIVLGGISRPDKGLRLDLHLIEPTSTAIVGVESVSCASEVELADAIAACTSNLLDHAFSGPGVLAASSREERRREALFVLGSSLRSINSTEAAYMLAGDDEQVRLGMIRSSCAMIESHGYYAGSGRPIFVGLLRHLAAFNDRLLANDDELLPLPTPSPLVIRAEMCRRVKDFTKVRDLAQQQLRKHPGQDEARTLILLAEAEEELGNISEAKAVLQQFLGKYDRGMLFWDVMNEVGGFGRASYIERNIGEHEIDHRAAYQGLRRRMIDGKYWVQPGEWKAFLEQQREYENDETILRELREVIRSGPHRISSSAKTGETQSILKARFLCREEFTWTWLYLAECELRSGHKTEAARAAKMLLHMANERWGGLQHLTTYPDLKSRRAFGNRQIERMCSRGKEIVDLVEKDIGPVDRLFQPIAVGKVWPDKYSVYVVPVGEGQPGVAEVPNRRSIKIGTAEDLAPITPESMACSLRTFYGASVSILPAIPLSEELKKRRALFDGVLSSVADELWADILPRARIPSNALYVVFLSREPYHTKYFRGDPWTLTRGNPILLGVDGTFQVRGAAILGFNAITAPRVMWGRSDPDVVTKMLNVESCDSYPCIFGSRIDGGVVEESDLACPGCQQRFAHMDFDNIHNELLAYLKSAGATILPVDHGVDPQ